MERITLKDGKTWEIYFYSGKSKSIPGRCTPWATILISEHLLLDKPLLNLVMLHESRHARQWYEWWVIIFLAIASEIFFIHSHYINGTFTIVLSMLYSWYIEFDADFYAIKYIGLNEYQSIAA